MNRRRVILLVLTILLMLITASQVTAAQKFPAKPVTIIIPYGAGGGVDMIARAFGTILPKYLGQPVVLTNLPGANGIIGTQNLSQQTPDGYNIGFYASPVIDTAPFINKVPYDPMNSFTFLATIVERPMVLCVNSNSPWKTFKEFTQHVNTHKGTTWGDPPAGTAYLAFQSIIKAFKLKDMKYIPFSGGDADAVVSLLGGHVGAVCALPVTVKEHIKAGKLRPLLVTGQERIKMLPDVPTAKESGENVVVTLTNGIFAPKGLSEDVVAVFNQAITKTSQDPEFLALTEKTGDWEFLKYIDGPSTKEMLKSSSDKMQALITELGLAKK
jgi:tripartite-type tricarboxylate transporter receptor subunit TctC